MQLELVLLQDLHGTGVSFLDELCHQSIHLFSRSRSAGERGVLVEILVLNRTQSHHAKLIRHTKTRHHVTRKLRCLLDIIGSARRHLTEDKLLGSTATAVDSELVKNLLLGCQELLVFLDLHRVSEGTGSARHDRNLGDGSRTLLTRRHDGMANLVIRDDLLLVIGKNRGLALLAGNDHLDRLFEILLSSALASHANGTKGALIDNVRKVGAGRARRGTRDGREVDWRLHLNVLSMKLKNRLAAGKVGKFNRDTAIEATGTKQGRVQAVGTVGSRKDNDALMVVKAIHLG